MKNVRISRPGSLQNADHALFVEFGEWTCTFLHQGHIEIPPGRGEGVPQRLVCVGCVFAVLFPAYAAEHTSQAFFFQVLMNSQSLSTMHCAEGDEKPSFTAENSQLIPGAAPAPGPSAVASRQPQLRRE